MEKPDLRQFFSLSIKNMEPTRPLTPKTPTRAGTSRGAKVIDAVTQEFSSAFDAYTLDAYRELFAVNSTTPPSSTINHIHIPINLFLLTFQPFPRTFFLFFLLMRSCDVVVWCCRISVLHPSNPSTTISQEYDDDGSGNIDAEELQSLLQASGKKVSAIEIRKLIEEVDSVENGGNGDGLISESEFLRMLRDNRGPNILSDLTRQRADGVKQRRLELEAFKMKKTEDKLEADKQKQIRKNQQLADEAARLRQANDDKARQVAEYNQSEYEKTTSEKQRVEREDRERKALVAKRQADRQQELNDAGRAKQAALDEAERLRIKNKQESDDRINNKNEMDKQKQQRKNQQLADEAARLRQANDDKARQVAEYNQREYDKTTSEKQRVEREDRERKALVKKKKQDEKDRLAAAGKKKAERIAKAKKAIQDKEDAKRIKLEKKNKGKKRFGLKGVL